MDAVCKEVGVQLHIKAQHLEDRTDHLEQRVIQIERKIEEFIN